MLIRAILSTLLGCLLVFKCFTEKLIRSRLDSAGGAAQRGHPTRAHCLSANSVITLVHRLMITASNSCRINKGIKRN